MAMALSKVINVMRLANSRSISTFYPRQAFWNKDWMPGPYPKTEEERKKAAEKYNLHPSEYKPYSDEDGRGYGDYPELPYVGQGTRDPHYPYDMPELRRNFNEPVHIEVSVLGEDRLCDYGEKLRYSYGYMAFVYFAVFGGTFGALYLSELYLPMFQPVMEKQYPWKGKKYYTFNKAE